MRLLLTRSHTFHHCLLLLLFFLPWNFCDVLIEIFHNIHWIWRDFLAIFDFFTIKSYFRHNLWWFTFNSFWFDRFYRHWHFIIRFTRLITRLVWNIININEEFGWVLNLRYDLWTHERVLENQLKLCKISNKLHDIQLVINFFLTLLI